MAKTKVEIKGLAKVIKRLNGLERKVQTKIVRQALRAGMKVVQLEAKADTPRGKTGDLKRAVKLRTMKRSRSRIGMNVIESNAALGEGKHYVASVELGAPGVNIEGQHPFRHAYRSKGQQAADTIVKVAIAGIEQAAKG